MTLHDAIVELLKQCGRSMTTTEIADELNRNNWYTKKDGSSITPFQIHGRTKNYPQLFSRKGSLVSLVNPLFKKSKEILTSSKAANKPLPVIKMPKIPVEKQLLNNSLFRKASEIDLFVPSMPGLYCIRINDPVKLPKTFSSELNKRGHNIIYIGQASQSLKTRFLNQELRAKGHGTFFRSIGAVLGYMPLKGSLINKKNKRNYKFTPSDEAKIILWINDNLLINWIEHNNNISMVESDLIFKYNPLLNLDGNPLAMDELRILRRECVRVANEVWI